MAHGVTHQLHAAQSFGFRSVEFFESEVGMTRYGCNDERRTGMALGECRVIQRVLQPVFQWRSIDVLHQMSRRHAKCKAA